MATIITRYGSGSGNAPSTLSQGELAINVTDGKLFYGSGSAGAVRTITASLALGVVPAAPLNSVQFNDSSALGGSGNFTYDNLNSVLFITGGLNLSNQNGQSPLTVVSGSDKVFTVTGSGVVVFGTYNAIPSPEAGGIYFDGTDFFLGF